MIWNFTPIYIFSTLRSTSIITKWPLLGGRGGLHILSWETTKCAMFWNLFKRNNYPIFYFLRNVRLCTQNSLIMDQNISPVPRKDMQTPLSPYPEVAIFTWKMPTVLNRMKNHISKFYIFLFFELWLFAFTLFGDTPGVPLTKK